jgi:uncharacterized protein YhjY with autotransporter beta-barrel domain
MRKMNLVLGRASLLSFLGVAGMSILTVHAQVINLTPTGNNLYNTGVEDDGVTPIPNAANLNPASSGLNNPADPHYTVSYDSTGAGPLAFVNPPVPVPPPVPATFNGTAYLAAPLPPGFAPNPATSQWITYQPNTGGPSGTNNASIEGTVLGTPSSATTDYHLVLTHIPLNQLVTINGLAAADDGIFGAGVKGTGATTTSLAAPGINFNFPNTLPTLTFVSGATNSLDFIVDNVGGYSTGINLQLTGFFQALQLPLGLNLTPNQKAVLNYINQINEEGSFDPSFGDLFTTFLNLDPGSYPVALDELSPEKLSIFSSLAFNNASFLTFDLDDYLAHRRDDDGSFQANTGIDSSGLNVGNPTLDPKAAQIESHLQAADSKNMVSDAKNDVVNTTPPPSSTDRWNVFIRGDVILSQDFSNFDLPNEDATTSSVMLGGDYQFSQNFLAGVFFDYSHTDANLDSFGSSATVDSYSPGIYASYAQDGWYGNAMAYYSRNAYTEERKININDTFVQTADGAPAGNQETFYTSGGYDFHKGPWTYGPTIGFQYVHLDISGFTESGGNVADLTVNNEVADSFRSRLGGHVIYTCQAGGMIITPFLDASWQHEFLDDSRPITSNFSQIGDGSFTVWTQDTGRESALLTTGANLDIDQMTTLFVNYQAQVTPNYYFGQSILAGVKVAF